jgi:transcriptional regulator with XRE-family HTH domain
MKESTPIASAIKALRKKLRETQAGMARLLGVSLRSYDRWEAGDTNPRGDVLIRMIDLCPDDETRSLFRSAAALDPALVSRNRLQRPLTCNRPADRLRMRLRDSCLQAIRIIYEAAVLGSAAADDALRTYADDLSRNAAMLAKHFLEPRRRVVD